MSKFKNKKRPIQYEAFSESTPLTIYEAFGSTSYNSFLRSHVVLVIEKIQNGRIRRFLVPKSRCQEGQWILWGRRVHVYLGHSFVEHRAKPGPIVLSCLPCIRRDFRLMQDHYKCRGSCLNSIYLKRCIASLSITLAVTVWGLKRKSIDWTGAVSGFFVGVILTFNSYCFLACLLIFFYTSSKATRFCSSRKKKFEADFKEGGQRNWIQVICNGGMAVEVALLYGMQGGVGECALDFGTNSFRSWLAAAALSALAGVNGDTWASELGTVLSKTEPRLITSFQKVPVGTNGGFTFSGLLYSALGGFVVGIAYFVALLLVGVQMKTAHQVILLSFIGVFAGTFGSLLDSVIGATLQYSGLEICSGKVVEQPGVGVQHISGRPILTNHSVNLIMSIIISIVVPTITIRLYSLFS